MGYKRINYSEIGDDSGTGTYESGTLVIDSSGNLKLHNGSTTGGVTVPVLNTNGNLTMPGTIWAKASDTGSIVFSNNGTDDNGSMKVDNGYNMVISTASNFYVKRAGNDRFAITDTTSTFMAESNLELKSNKSGSEYTWKFGNTGTTQFPGSKILAPVSESITMQSDQYSQLMWENANVTVAPNMAINSNFYVSQNNATLDIVYRDGSSTQVIKSWYWNADGSLALPAGGVIAEGIQLDTTRGLIRKIYSEYLGGYAIPNPTYSQLAAAIVTWTADATDTVNPISWTGIPEQTWELTGYFRAPEAGTYTFNGSADDYYFIIIDGDVSPVPEINTPAVVALTHGQVVSYRVLFANVAGSGTLDLQWKNTGSQTSYTNDFTGLISTVTGETIDLTINNSKWIFGKDGTTTLPTVPWNYVPATFTAIPVTYGDTQLTFTVQPNNTITDMSVAVGASGYGPDDFDLTIPGSTFPGGTSPLNDIVFNVTTFESSGPVYSTATNSVVTYVSGTLPPRYDNISSSSSVGIGAGEEHWTFGADGSLTLPSGSAIGETPSVSTNITVNNHAWAFDVNGNLTLPAVGAGINYANGQSILDGLGGGSSYGNSNVANYLPNYTGNYAGNIASLTGNVTAGYFIGNGSQLTGLPASYANANVATFLAGLGSNAVSTTGNVSANYFIGNGSQLTDITVSTATTAATVTTASQPNITSVGTLSGLTVGPNSSVVLSGTAGYLKANSLQGTDGTQTIYLHYGSVAGAAGVNTNLTVGAGGTGNLSVAGTMSAIGNVTGNYFLGNGSQLTGVTVSTAATVTTNAQPNITSLGTLTSLSLTGNANITGNLSMSGTILTGSQISGGVISGTGNIRGSNLFTMGIISGTGTLTAGNLTTGGVASATGNITGANIITAGLVTAVGNVIAGNVNTANTISATGNIRSNSSFIASNVSGTISIGNTNSYMMGIGNANSYVQSYVHNKSNTSEASADMIVYGSAGTDNSGYMDMGMTSNNFSSSFFTVTGKSEGYLFMSGVAGTSGNMVLATGPDGSNNSIEFYVGGFASAKGANRPLLITKETTTVTGNLSVTGNITGNGAGLTNVTAQVTGSWTLAPGTNTVSLSVPINGTYSIWVRGNIPSGIVAYTATVVVTNTNVPVLGTSYGWYYVDGNQLVLTAIPTQIIGTLNNISTTSVSTTTANVFTFGITNNSGTSQVVSYGYTKLG